MSSTFRNSKGDLIDLQAVPATQLKNAFAAVLDRAVHDGAVAITRHDQPRAVLVSYAEFEALVKLRSPGLDDLSSEFDALLASMQTAKAKKGMKSAFDASPAQLGKAAVHAGMPRATPVKKAAGATARKR